MDLICLDLIMGRPTQPARKKSDPTWPNDATGRARAKIFDPKPDPTQKLNLKAQNRPDPTQPDHVMGWARAKNFDPTIRKNLTRTLLMIRSRYVVQESNIFIYKVKNRVQ